MKSQVAFGKVKKSLIAIGNPIVDISADADEESIKKFNLHWGGTVFINDENKGMFDVLEKTPNVSYVPGGSVQNTLRVASWCFGMTPEIKDNYKLTMLGCLGNDEYKEKLLNVLKKVGVNPLMQTNDELPTSRCAVAIHKKERSLISAIKASNKLSLEFVKENINQILEHDCLIVEGYFLVEKIDIINYLIQEFKKLNKIVIMTISATFIVKNAYDKVMETAKHADMIIGNLEELESILEKPGKTPIESFEMLHKKFGRNDGRIIVSTAGSQGVYVSQYDYDEDRFSYIVQTFAKLIKHEDIVDFNGAGDAFLGGFLSQWMQGKSSIACCRAGNDAAGIILKNVGCTFPHDGKITFDD